MEARLWKLETRTFKVQDLAAKKQHQGHDRLIFIACLSLVFSTFGLLVSGFLAYQFFELQEEQDLRKDINRDSATALKLEA